jgi:hypothetical protein
MHHTSGGIFVLLTYIYKQNDDYVFTVLSYLGVLVTINLSKYVCLSYIPGLIFGHCSLANLSSSNSCPAATNSNRVNSPLPLPLKYVTLIDDISLHTVTR